MRVALVCLSWLVCAGAHAQTVELTIAGSEESQTYLRETIAELLAPIVELRELERLDVLEVRNVVFPPEHPSRALARVWIEVSADRVTLYLVDATWERILVRHVPSPSGLDEAAREEVGQIVRAAVEALLGGARIGITRAEASEQLDVRPEPPPPPPRPAPAPPAPPGLRATGDLTIGYSGQLFADGPTIRSAPSLVLALRLGETSVRPVVALGLDFFPTTTSLAEGLALDLRTWILRIEGGVDVEVVDGTSIRAGGGLALDITAVEPRFVDGSLTRAAAAYDALGPLITLRVALVQRLWEWLGAMAALVTDLDPIDARYVVATTRGDRTVIDPFVARFTLVLGVGALWR